MLGRPGAPMLQLVIDEHQQSPASSSGEQHHSADSGYASASTKSSLSNPKTDLEDVSISLPPPSARRRPSSLPGPDNRSNNPFAATPSSSSSSSSSTSASPPSTIRAQPSSHPSSSNTSLISDSVSSSIASDAGADEDRTAVLQHQQEPHRHAQPSPGNPTSIVTAAAASSSSTSSSSRRNVKQLSLTSHEPLVSFPKPPRSRLASSASMQSLVPSKVPLSLPPSPIFQNKPSLRNRTLSIQTLALDTINLPSSSSAIGGGGVVAPTPVRRRPSVVSLPPVQSQPLPRTAGGRNLRAVEDEALGEPYANGPIEILSGVWLGAEYNAIDYPTLQKLGIGAVLNVAKEVVLPFEEEDEDEDQNEDRKTRSRTNWTSDPETCGVRYEADGFGRPELVYLHLPWSHGQQDLVRKGFQDAMTFVDNCLARKTGVLIHCQLGVSRSATMIIGYVMRLMYGQDAPPHLAALRAEGMQGAYNYVKSKSQWVGPNMSLIYQLLEYDRHLAPKIRIPSTAGSATSELSEEEEWAKQRLLMEQRDAEEERASRSRSHSRESAEFSDGLGGENGDDDADLDRGMSSYDSPGGIERAEAQELDMRMAARRQQTISRRSSAASSVDMHAAPRNSKALRRGRDRVLSSGSETSLLSRSSLASNPSVAGLDETLHADGDAPWVRVNEEPKPMAVVEEDRSSMSPVVHLAMPRGPRPVVFLPPLDSITARKRNSITSLSSFTSIDEEDSPSMPPLSATPLQTTFGAPMPPPSVSSSSSSSPSSAHPHRRSIVPPPLSRANKLLSLRRPTLETVPSSPSAAEYDSGPSMERRGTGGGSGGGAGSKIAPIKLKIAPEARFKAPIDLALEQEDVLLSQRGRSLSRSQTSDSSSARSTSASRSAVKSPESDQSSHPAHGIKKRRKRGARAGKNVQKARAAAAASLNEYVFPAQSESASTTSRQTLYVFPTSSERGDPQTLAEEDEGDEENGMKTARPPPTPSRVLVTSTMLKTTPPRPHPNGRVALQTLIPPTSPTTATAQMHARGWISMTSTGAEMANALSTASHQNTTRGLDSPMTPSTARPR